MMNAPNAAAVAAARNNNNTNAPPTVASQQPDVEARLHNVAASFRKSRDEAHREHQLAVERLTLATQESEALQKTVNDMKAQLEALQKKAGSSQERQRELQQLQTDVAMLNKEVRTNKSR
jgi:predicted RNase H-like nuclease (RuvC/YqgF family)